MIHIRILSNFRYACTHFLQICSALDRLGLQQFPTNMIMSICPGIYSYYFAALDFLLSSSLACSLLLLSLFLLLVPWLFCCFSLFFLLLLSVSWLSLRSAFLPASLCFLLFPPSAFFLLLCAPKSKIHQGPFPDHTKATSLQIPGFRKRLTPLDA